MITINIHIYNHIHTWRNNKRPFDRPFPCFFRKCALAQCVFLCFHLKVANCNTSGWFLTAVSCVSKIGISETCRPNTGRGNLKHKPSCQCTMPHGILKNFPRIEQIGGQKCRYTTRNDNSVLTPLDQPRFVYLKVPDRPVTCCDILRCFMISL